MKSTGPSMKVRCSAFTMAELLTIIAVVAFTLLLMLPAYFANDGRPSARIRCASNLKQVGLAFRIWEGDNNDCFPMQIYTNKLGEPLFFTATDQFHYFQVMSNELSNPQILLCPADSKRKEATNFSSGFDSSHISYFVGLDARESLPQCFLAGDSHITPSVPSRKGLLEITAKQGIGWSKKRHDGGGNVLMGDGSVQQFSATALPIALQHTGLATNRLLMPQ